MKIHKILKSILLFKKVKSSENENQSENEVQNEEFKGLDKDLLAKTREKILADQIELSHNEQEILYFFEFA